jgi:hypothetical protein
MFHPPHETLLSRSGDLAWAWPLTPAPLTTFHSLLPGGRHRVGRSRNAADVRARDALPLREALALPPGEIRPHGAFQLCLSLFGRKSLVSRALFRAKVDGFVPQTQHVNLRIVGQPACGGAVPVREAVEVPRGEVRPHGTLKDLFGRDSGTIITIRVLKWMYSPL